MSSTNYEDALRGLDSSYTEADAIVNVGRAVLAVADELRATREAAKPEVTPEGAEGSKYAYVLTRTFEDGTSDVVSVYMDQDRVSREVQDLNIMSATQNAGVTWKYAPHVLNKGV